MYSTDAPTSNLEAKICVLGAQGVGKTSLLHRFIHGTFAPNTTPSTVGASFLTKRLLDIDTSTTVRLQLWDTAGQERFRSITKLYYRGASAVILVYSIVDESSFAEMGQWLKEVKDNLGENVIVHVVGTKADIVAQDPTKRQVPFERVIAYVAENLYDQGKATTGSLPASAGSLGSMMAQAPQGRPRRGTARHERSRSRGSSELLDGARKGGGEGGMRPNSGLWANDAGWDVCHEISSSSGEGIEEVFRVITRKLVEKSIKKSEEDALTPGVGGLSPAGGADGGTGYFDRTVRSGSAGGSFRLGTGDKRRSWLLGFPTPSIGGDEDATRTGTDNGEVGRKGGCC